MAYTAAPLQNREYRADSSDPGNDKGDHFVEPASVVITANHDPGRDDGGPLGWGDCRSGWEVVGDHPKPTWHMPMRRDTATAGVHVCGAVVLLGEPAIEPDAPFPALECDGGKATPVFTPCKVSTDGMVSIPTLEGGDNDIEGLCISPTSQVCQCRRLQNTATPPPVEFIGEGVDRGGREGAAELGDGIAAPVDAGEGAIDPS